MPDTIDIKDTLSKLLGGEILTKEEAKHTLKAIGQGEVNEYQTVSLLTSYSMRPITGLELSGFREAMIDLALLVDLSDYEIIDLCGTGGDGKNTFNISTLAAVVVAGAGYKVAKHGNTGKSSVCGSSNVLEHLGYRMTNDPQELKRSIEKSNFCYLHAPLFHPAMKQVGAIRKGLGFSTFFNILGPLLNPSQPQNQLTGVARKEIMPLYQEVFEDMGSSFTIVHSEDGYDEISLTSSFQIINNKGTFDLHPDELGLKKIASSSIKGGKTVEKSVDLFVDILKGEGSSAQEDVVAVNAGYGIQLFSPSQSIEDCIEEARESIKSGNAYKVVKSFSNR